MKTKEELNALKEKEVESESRKLHELTDEELEQVSGGEGQPSCYALSPITIQLANLMPPKCRSCSWKSTCERDPD